VATTSSIQTCYRHGDRRAGVICQRCDRPICPECMHQASVGFHCPECARKGRQRVYTPRTLVTQPYITLALIAVNAVVFLLDLSSAGDSLRDVGSLGGDAGLYGPAVADGDWWRPITAGFVHAGLVHLGLNMFILYQLGTLLEPTLGRIAYLSLYLMSLVGGSFLVLVLDPEDLTVGASGAVFGLMGAAVVGLRARGINPFSTSLGMLLVINLILTFSLSSVVSVGGHIRGLVAGLAGGWLMFELAPRIAGQQSGGRQLAVGRWVASGLCVAAAAALYAGCLYIASNPV
jgi:membrane associated rhomboid family serine protease